MRHSFQIDRRGYSTLKAHHAGPPRHNRRLPTFLYQLGIALMLLQPVSWAGTGDTRCQNTNLQVLGSGGPELNDGRGSSAYLLWLEDRARVLFDAGSGSSVAFGASGADFADLEAILLSHLHTDHAGDLHAFVKGSFFSRRHTDLIVAGPKGNERMPATTVFLNRLIGPDGAFRYLQSYLQHGSESYTLRPITMPAHERGELDASAWQARSLPVTHGPIPAIAWRVETADCIVVYSGDMTAPTRDFDAFAKGADLLILHAAIPENAGSSAKALHMTPGELVVTAERLAPRLVLFSHFMRRSEASESQLRAMSVPAVMARDGLLLNLRDLSE